MKKNISINISGIIFHIEEDGYETLKKYLDSINKYFSTFEDSSEILADIEGRIAEIFLSKLNEEKQVITLDDVNNLVTVMGSVSDFKAAEARESEDANSDAGAEPGDEASAGPQTSSAYTAPKSLMRDQKRKILGGVCAGLGQYFNVDPLWIRLLFALLFIAYGVTFFIYVIMWIVVPGSYDLDEPTVGKKMYRDPERKIIGGVSSGVAAYLGIDVVAVRVLFIVFTIVGGIGLFLYIVLWIILPEARTLTDRVRMQGEPVTLSSIESTLKKNRSDTGSEESTLTRVVLFPFRLIGMILNALARMLDPLVDILRVAIGIVLAICGLGMAFSLVVSGGVLAGFFTAASFSWPWGELRDAAIPLDAMVRAFPVWTAVAGFTAGIIPAVFLVLLGLSAISKRIVFSAAAGWTLFVLFFVSSAVLAVSIPKIAFSFHEEGTHRVESTFNVQGSKAVLRMHEIGLDGYDAVDLELRGHGEKQFKLREEFEAQGFSRADAIKNARMVTYNVDFRDSVFTFDSNLTFPEDAVFRAQRLDMVLYIPYDFPFMMEEGVARFISNYVHCCGWEGTDEVYRYTWIMSEDEGLQCLDCPDLRDADDDNDDRGEDLQPISGIADLSDFDEIEITGHFDLTISNSDRYAVVIRGSEREKSRYRVYRTGRTLVVDYNGRKRMRWDDGDIDLEEIHIDIAMPELEKIEASGIGSIKFDAFRGDDIEIEGRGPVRVRGSLRSERLTLSLTGSAEADLSGKADRLNAHLRMASMLRAYDLDVRDAIVEVAGFSTARVHVRERLEIDRGIASEVDYRGNPDVVWID